MKKAMFRQYFRRNCGVAALWFGFMMPLVVTSVGVSVDISKAYLVRERLSHALDAAALAAAASPSDNPDLIERKVQDFVDANYPPDKIGYTLDIDVDPQGDNLYVSATAEVATSFMNIAGIKTIDVEVETAVKREVKAIEVALVMDVTGSMATNNNIAALRVAATDFVNIMFDRTEDEEFLKIGLVPFSSTVNVGPYGLGKTLNGTTYGTRFVNNPRNLSWSLTNTNQWRGCILEERDPKDSRDHTGNWDMYQWCRDENNGSPTCDRSWDSRRRTYVANREANHLCPRTPVVPLTNEKQVLLDSISSLRAEGNTYINIGLVWGLRLISPEFPFQEGVEWTNQNWKKAVILMTDGENTRQGTYSIYGKDNDPNPTVSDTQLDARVTKVCNALKAKGVLVYTITFDSGVSSATKTLFRNCATQPNMWYDAPTQAKLKEVYAGIAKELSNLRLTK